MLLKGWRLGRDRAALLGDPLTDLGGVLPPQLAPATQHGCSLTRSPSRPVALGSSGPHWRRRHRPRTQHTVRPAPRRGYHRDRVAVAGPPPPSHEQLVLTVVPDDAHRPRWKANPRNQRQPSPRCTARSRAPPRFRPGGGGPHGLLPVGLVTVPRTRHRRRRLGRRRRGVGRTPAPQGRRRGGPCPRPPIRPRWGRRTRSC